MNILEEQPSFWHRLHMQTLESLMGLFVILIVLRWLFKLTAPDWMIGMFS